MIARLVRQEVGLLLDERVQELEERRRREAHDVVVVTLDLAHEHPTEPLRADDYRVSVNVRSQVRCRIVRRVGKECTHLDGEPACTVAALAVLDVRAEERLVVLRKVDERALIN